MLLKHSIEYSIGRYHIGINLWFLIIFLLLQTLLNELGFWQLNRAKEKQALMEQLESGSQSSLSSLASISQKELKQFQMLELEMELLNKPSLFLENQIRDKQHGYHVLNVAKDISSGKMMLVNRGWIFAGSDRRNPPQVDNPPKHWKVTGRIYPIAEKITFSEGVEVEVLDSALRVPLIDQVILEDLKEKYNLVLEPYLLRLNKKSPAAFNTDWIWSNMPPEKHLAYAFQWFALAFAFLIISIFACTKKRQRGE